MDHSCKFVYLVRSGEDHYKVGIAQNLANRIAGIQTGNQHAIELVHHIYVAKAGVIERELHKWLDDHRADGGTEWFALTATEAIDLVMKMTSYTMIDDMMKYLEMRNLAERISKTEEALKGLEELVQEYAKSTPNKPSKKMPSYEEIFEEPTFYPVQKQEPQVSERDPLFDLAVDLIMEAGKGSTSMLQRKLRIGYARAARLIDELEAANVVSPQDGARPRNVL